MLFFVCDIIYLQNGFKKKAPKKLDFFESCTFTLEKLIFLAKFFGDDLHISTLSSLCIAFVTIFGIKN